MYRYANNSFDYRDKTQNSIYGTQCLTNLEFKLLHLMMPKNTFLEYKTRNGFIHQGYAPFSVA